MTANPYYWNHYSNSTTGLSDYNSFDRFRFTDCTASASVTSWLSPTTYATTYSPNYTQYTQQDYYQPQYIHQSDNVPNIETEEQKAERLRLESEANKRANQLKIEKEAAEKKARELLLEYLDEKNKERYLKKEPLIVESQLLKDVSYHIPISYSRIKAIKEDKVLSELCVTVNDSEIPLEDEILTKLLYAKNDELNLLKSANHWNVKQNLLAELN